MNETFIRHFSIIQDPRIDRCKKHQLIDILFLSICAVITGAEGWEDIEDFAHIKIDWLRKYCAFANGIPRHDTIARVISRLNPKEVQSSFVSWINEILEHMDGNVIAIDGKTARGSFTTKERKNALHMVSAWSCGHQLVLGQSRVDQKSNEITAIPKLLDLLELQNNIVTLDAMGCQKEIAAKIVQKKGDYVIGLKGNQEGLQKELEALYHKQEREGLNELNSDEYETIDSGHGRIEKRRCRQMLIDWNGNTFSNKFRKVTFHQFIDLI